MNEREKMKLHIEIKPETASRLLEVASDFKSHTMGQTIDEIVLALHHSKNRKKLSRLIREARKIGALQNV